MKIRISWLLYVVIKKIMKDVVNYCSLSHIDCSIGHVLEAASVPI
jgi:hypothetical protein